MTKPLPTQQYLQQRLSYDADTGLLRWKPWPGRSPQWNGRYAHQIAGSEHDGRIIVRLDDIAFYAHRLIWKMVYAFDPSLIDHADGDGTQNNIMNLREATPAQNLQNMRTPQRNTSGYRGAFWHRLYNKWMAQIRADKRCVYLGYFDTAEEAGAVYTEAAKRLHKEFAFSNRKGEQSI